MEYFVPMQILETCEDTGCEETSFGFDEFMFFTDMIAEVTSWHEIHDKVEMISVLKCLFHIDYKWMFDNFE
jgi:hypothetical protein